MVGYKDWVLGENVIPGVVLKVNELLEKMCARHRVLTVAHDEVGGYGMVDGKNRVPIEKASGFQRFALSLAMRIVLGTYGVAGIKNRQLFIDEGFTACDGDNLEVVPEVLKGLLGKYDSVVIVSHLDKLQDVIDEKIVIKRDEGVIVTGKPS